MLAHDGRGLESDVGWVKTSLRHFPGRAFSEPYYGMGGERSKALATTRTGHHETVEVK
jgi:hypothetical protein